VSTSANAIVVGSGQKVVSSRLAPSALSRSASSRPNRSCERWPRNDVGTPRRARGAGGVERATARRRPVRAVLALDHVDQSLPANTTTQSSFAARGSGDAPIPDHGPEMLLATTETFDVQVAGYRKELLVHCYRMLGTIDEAEDAVQEALTRAWKGRHSYRRNISLRAWLYRIATNVCLNAIRRARGRRRTPSVSRPPAGGREPGRGRARRAPTTRTSRSRCPS